MKQHEDVVEQFARALDREDYQAASALLAPDCVYTSRTSLHTGPAAIIESYKANADWAAATLDSIRYESQIEPLGNNRWTVTFIDHITHKGRSLTYTSKQVVTVDNAALICRIDHTDIPAQNHALEQFFKYTGVTRQE